MQSRVLSAVYLGWSALPGLFLAHLLSWYLIFGEVTVFQLLAILVSASGCNIAVVLLQSSYIAQRQPIYVLSMRVSTGMFSL